MRAFSGNTVGQVPVKQVMATAEKPWEEQVVEIAKQYEWEDAIPKFLLDKSTGAGTTKLADFLKLVSEEKEIGPMINAMDGVKNRIQQKSRFRQAWVGVREAFAQQDSMKRKRADDTDMDMVLPQPELDNLQDAYWARYHLVWPPNVAPADTLVSRIFKEITKRALQTRDIWKTRNQMQYLRAQTKKTKLAGDIEIVQSNEDSEETIENYNVTKYLELSFTLFLAFSIAGSTKRTGAPAASTEARLTDACLMVEVPQDTIMKVYHRAAQKVQLISPAQALQWVSVRIDGEIEAWVDKFRNTSASLGKCIQATYDRREAVWDVEKPAADAPSNRPPLSSQHQAKPSKRKAAEQQNEEHEEQSEQPKMAKAWSKQLKDGKKICQLFNQGKCRNAKKKCPNGAHICAGLQPNGRVCGMNHGAAKCTNRRVTKQ